MTKARKMSVAEALEEAATLQLVERELFEKRGKLLRYIRANRDYLITPHFIDKAKRGYLKDLPNYQIEIAVREIAVSLTQ